MTEQVDGSDDDDEEGDEGDEQNTFPGVVIDDEVEEEP